MTLYLAFYVAATHVLSGICFDVLCGILSAILSSAYFTIVFGILLDVCVDSFLIFFDKCFNILSRIYLAFILTLHAATLLAFYLAYILLAFYVAFFLALYYRNGEEH